MAEFFTPAVRPLEQLKVICAVSKLSDGGKPIVLQRCFHEKLLKYVPVFFEYTQSKKCLREETLISDYYLFEIRNEVEWMTGPGKDILSR